MSGPASVDLDMFYCIYSDYLTYKILRICPRVNRPNRLILEPTIVDAHGIGDENNPPSNQCLFVYGGF